LIVSREEPAAETRNPGLGAGTAGLTGSGLGAGRGGGAADLGDGRGTDLDVAFLAAPAGLEPRVWETARLTPGWPPFDGFRFAALAAGGRTAARAADV